MENNYDKLKNFLDECLNNSIVDKVINILSEAKQDSDSKLTIIKITDKSYMLFKQNKPILALCKANNTCFVDLNPSAHGKDAKIVSEEDYDKIINEISTFEKETSENEEVAISSTLLDILSNIKKNKFAYKVAWHGPLTVIFNDPNEDPIITIGIKDDKIYASLNSREISTLNPISEEGTPIIKKAVEYIRSNCKNELDGTLIPEILEIVDTLSPSVRASFVNKILNSRGI